MSKHPYKIGRPALERGVENVDGGTDNIVFRLSKTEHAALRAHVALKGNSKSVLIREALEHAGLLTPPAKTSRRRRQE